MSLLLRLIDGLYLPEIVLIILGTMLFFVFVWILVHKTLNGDSIVTMVPMLMIPVIMIGYPTITKIHIGKDGADIERLTNRYPSTSGREAEKIREEIKVHLKNIEERPIENPEMQVSIAKAQDAIGDKNKALSTVNKVLSKRPDFREALKLHDKLSPP